MDIIEIPPQQFSKISVLLDSYNDYPVVNAIIEGNSPGRVFVDNPAETQSAFALTNAGFSYLIGSPQKESFHLGLKELLENDLFPVIWDSDDPTLIFYPLANGWEAPLKEILDQHEVHDIFRRQFAFNREKFIRAGNWLSQIPTDFAMCPIDQALVDKTGSAMSPWDSPQAFLAKGFGFWLMAGEEIACECSSVFVGGGAVEINIYTQEKYRKQGLATITASAFIQESLARGLRPNWECWWENEPSIALAQKLGFEPIRDHAVYLVEFEKTKS